MQSSTTIAEMAKKLQLRNETQGTTALFLGSKAGGLFRSLRLYDTLRFFEPKNLYSLTPLERYRQCYKILCDTGFSPQDIHNILSNKELLQEIRAEVPELCIAKLSKQGFFNPILSTSMYGEFEDAFQQIGMKVMFDFAIEQLKKSPDTPLIYAEKRYLFTLTKVFGDISSRDYNITRRLRHLEENKDLDKTLKELRNANILIVGADQTWDQYVIRALFPHSVGGGVWYVNDEEPTDLSEDLKDCKAELILGVDGRYEDFFRSLCWHVTGAVPTYQAALEALDKVQEELRENQNAVQRLANQIGDLQAEIGGLRSELRQFFASSLAHNSASEAKATSKILEEK